MPVNSEQSFLFDDPEPSSKPKAASRPPRDEEPQQRAYKPLAMRMRPRRLAEVTGHGQILGEGSLLPRLIKANTFGSILFYGPPGCGKTTLAEVIAGETGSRFVRINAVMSNVKEMRDVLGFARARPEDRTLLFIDEIHRFNKAQQDLLLPDVEQGNVRLIGATTHNPGFYVIPPLLSRSHLFRLEPLSSEDIAAVLERALTDTERGLGASEHPAETSVLLDLANVSDGDLRRALNALETIAAGLEKGAAITEDDVAVFAKERRIRYDANEDEHYDTASAFIKSMRGCDPDASLYWLAKMLTGGEDPRFIARRLVILASEDVGLADPHALPLAVAAFQACEQVGLPECELNLAHAVLYLATCPKSNSATEGIARAKAALRDAPVQPVPLHLRDSHTKLNKKLGHGKEYLYSHDFPEAISGQEYMEQPLPLYDPKPTGAEREVSERLKRWRQLKDSRKRGTTDPGSQLRTRSASRQ